MKKFLFVSMVAFLPLSILGTALSSLAPTKKGLKAAEVIDAQFSRSKSYFVGSGAKKCSFFIWPDSVENFVIYQVDHEREMVTPSGSVFLIFVSQFLLAFLVSGVGLVLLRNLK